MRAIQSDRSGYTLDLAKDELMVLNNALDEVCNGPNAVEAWEFHARLGVKQEEARTLLAAIGSLLDDDDGEGYFDALR